MKPAFPKGSSSFLLSDCKSVRKSAQLCEFRHRISRCICLQTCLFFMGLLSFVPSDLHNSRPNWGWEARVPCPLRLRR